MRTILIGLALFCTSLSPVYTPVYAQEEVVVEENVFPDADGERSSQRQVMNVRALFFRTLFLLIGLCALVIGGGYLLKRITGGRLSSFSTNGSILLIERKYLSPKSSIWLLEVQGQPIVVVDSQSGVAIHALRESPKPITHDI